MVQAVSKVQGLFRRRQKRKAAKEEDGDEDGERKRKKPTGPRYEIEQPGLKSRIVLGYMEKNIYPDLVPCFKEVGLFIRSSDEF